MENVFIYLIKASGLIGLFYFAYFLLLRKETFFTGNRWFLLFGLITSSVLPLYFITKIIWVEPITESFDWSNIPVTTSVAESNPEINWYLILACVYFIGIVILFLKLVFDFISLNKLFRGKTVQKQGKFKLIDIAENITPFSYFNSIVYNSSLYTAIELENILEHEKVHSLQRHSIDVLISRLFCIVFWFNPLIWLYKKAIEQNLEFIADNEAAKKITDKKAYQFTLLKITTQKNCVALTNHFYQSLIKKRIIMLNQNQSKKSNSWKYALVLPVLIAFVFLFQIEVVAQEKETPKEESETKSEPIDFKLFKTEKDLTNLSKDKDIYINGEKSTKEELDKLNPNDIEKIDVAKINNKEVILITSKHLIKSVKTTDKNIYINDAKSTNENFNKLDQSTVDKVDVNTFENTIKITTKKEKPLIIINGIKQDSNFKIEDLDPENIQSINVLKGDHATMKYNESGKNGVLEVTTKEKLVLNNFNPIPRKTAQGFQILREEKKKEVVTNIINFIITKNTTDEEIKEKCEQIKNLHNINLTFFNIKRNSNGEITNIESKNDVIPRSYKQSENPIEPFKFYYEKKTNGGFTSGYAVLSNSISRIIENKTIDYKKAVIIIDGKQSNYQDLEKINPKEVKRVITKDIKRSPEENKKYIELYGEKALYGFLIEIQTNDYYNKNN